MALVIALLPGPLQGRPVCPGDCNEDCVVRIDELILLIRFALESSSAAECGDADVFADGVIGIDDLIAAVGSALNGCVSPCRSTPTPSPTPTWGFVEVAAAAGLNHEHRYDGALVFPGETAMFMGGAAGGDFDGDGFVDLFLVGGDLGADRLYRNRGDGTFEDVSTAYGLDQQHGRSCGAVFADVNGDEHLDLFVGGVEGTPARLLMNRRGWFEDVTEAAGLHNAHEVFSGAFGDPDNDGDLDLVVAHWGVTGEAQRNAESFFRNMGGGRFEGATESAGLTDISVPLANSALRALYSFTPNFADINNDRWPDLLVASDFGTSRVFLNRGDGTFFSARTSEISDENGMGASVADYDNDGDLDWFVTSIHDPNGVSESFWGISGNRLYRNRGDGTFEDFTTLAGVREGYWGWASCFADFNNDGHLDLFHVNGFGRLDARTAPRVFEGAEEFLDDPSRLFVSRGDGTFAEQSEARGLSDRGMGRGVVCFDYDRDGDVDILVANNGERVRLFRNENGNHRGFLGVRLRAAGENTAAIGARITLRSASSTQIREIRAGSNFASADPAEAHFGTAFEEVQELRVRWPDGSETVITDPPANRWIVLDLLGDSRSVRLQLPARVH